MADETMQIPETVPEAAPESVPQPVPAMADGSLVTAAQPEPVTYEDFTLPEGAVLESEALDQARALFAQSKLPQEQAQKFIDLAGLHP
jgi:hypothetical protein